MTYNLSKFAKQKKINNLENSLEIYVLNMLLNNCLIMLM